MKNLRKTILGASVALLICVTLFVGATFAWFTDSVRNGGNTIQTGNVDVILEKHTSDGYINLEENLDKIFNNENVMPSYAKYAIFKLTNNGSLDIKYEFNIMNTNAPIEIKDNMMVYSSNILSEEIVADDYSVANYDKLVENTNYNKVGSVNEVEDSFIVKGSLLSKKSAYFAVAFALPNSAGNEVMNKKLTFDLVLRATQNVDGAYFEQVNIPSTSSAKENGDKLVQAIADAQNGTLITLNAGNYEISRSITISKGITIMGVGEDTIIQTGIDSGIGSPIFTIKSSDVIFKNIKMQSMLGSNSRQYRFIDVPTTSNIDNLLVDNVIFDTAFMGITIYADAQVGSDVNNEKTSNITIQNSTFNNLNGKGIYLEKGNNVTIKNNTFTNIGAADYAFGSAIDINLKNGDYSDYTITGNNISNIDTTIETAGAILLKARGTGNDTGYATIPATIANVTITGNTIDCTRYLIIGEKGKNNTDISLTTDIEEGFIVNYSQKA